MPVLFLMTLLLTLLVVGGVIYGLLHINTITYRLNSNNVICLLRLMLTGQATENDWNVFVSYPIRHCPQLEAVRQRCREIDATEYLGTTRQPGREGYLLTRKGLKMLEEVLNELEHDRNQDQLDER